MSGENLHYDLDLGSQFLGQSQASHPSAGEEVNLFRSDVHHPNILLSPEPLILVQDMTSVNTGPGMASDVFPASNHGGNFRAIGTTDQGTTNFGTTDQGTTNFGTTDQATNFGTTDHFNSGIVFPHPLQNIQRSNYLSADPIGYSLMKSPSSDTHSTHSLYSDITLNPGSPFQDSVSYMSHSGSFVEQNNAMNAMDSLHAIEDMDAINGPGTLNYGASTLHPHGNSRNDFDQEICLGESVSSTNLSQLNSGGVNMQQLETQKLMELPQFAFDSAESEPKQFPPEQKRQTVHLLTENNLFNYNTNYNGNYASPQTGFYDKDMNNFGDKDVNGFGDKVINDHNVPPVYQPAVNAPHIFVENSISPQGVNSYGNNRNQVFISIDKAPEQVAAQTPSLFSNSSRNSSSHDLVNSAYDQEKSPLEASKFDTLQEAERAVSTGLLNPGHIISRHNSRTLYGSESAGRSRSRTNSNANSRVNSRANSRSRSPYSLDESDLEGDTTEGVAITSRQRMLELANTQASKCKQKNPSLYECHLCEKRFTRPYNLKSHLRTHTDERPFLCKVCGKGFARQHDRKRHEDLHLGEKKYMCKGLLRDGTAIGCGKRFARADALRRHFHTELGKLCIRLLLEEDERENDGELVSGIQLPSGKFMNPHQQPEVSIPSIIEPK